MDDIVRKCKTFSDCNFRTLSCGPKIDLVAFSYNFLLFYLLYQVHRAGVCLAILSWHVQ